MSVADSVINDAHPLGEACDRAFAKWLIAVDSAATFRGEPLIGDLKIAWRACWAYMVKGDG